MDTDEQMNPHGKWLMKAADEIRAEGHAGWGNTCEQAAAELQRLTDALAAKQSELDEAGLEVARQFNKRATARSEGAADMQRRRADVICDFGLHEGGAIISAIEALPPIEMQEPTK